MAAAVSIAELPPGTVVGGYRLSGLLGRGGMGAVYLAEQLSIGRKVALKLFSSRKLGNKVDRFMREAQIAAQLQHPALVAVHEVGDDPERGLHFYSMEYVHGRTLRTLVAQEGPQDPAFACELLLQVANGLAHAHRQGLVHRDIKPENIMLDESGLAKLADLGLATDLVGGAGQMGGRVLSVVGTPGWSAPEQLRNPKRTCPQSDVFGLGCVLSFLVTGVEPFSGETLIDLAVRVCTEDPAGVDALPTRWRELIARFTAKDPAHRPENGGAAAYLLEAGEVEPTTTPSGGSPVIATGRRRRPRRRR